MKLIMNSPARDRMLAAASPELTPIGRGGKPEEVADVIVFLCSEEASFVSAATWYVDGGRLG
jgi:NAD(P)-dependent dehydrogenase (short-subunit alcohol dehydrogenase family)